LKKYFYVYLVKAKSYQGLKEWEKAKDLYELQLEVLGDNHADSEWQKSKHPILVVLSRCYYEIGNNERCISFSKKLISSDPYIPACHKNKAWSEKAQGRYNDSIHTMIKAFIYEPPWDEKNKKIQLDLYDEIVADAAKGFCIVKVAREHPVRFAVEEVQKGLRTTRIARRWTI
jgi:tetratricopeptide (TPR) repeat protein